MRDEFYSGFDPSAFPPSFRFGSLILSTIAIGMILFETLAVVAI